jgi:hypothetical protein
VEVVADADGLTGRAGLPLVLETMRALGLDHAIAQHVQCRARQRGYTETAKIEALVLLLAAGGDCLDDIAPLQGLARVNTARVHGVAARGRGTQATLDHDATLQESHKREARPHYQGGRGYQPAALYWVEQDLVVADAYRDGNVGAGMENLPLIQRGFASLPPTVTTDAFRADSACYDERVLKWLADPHRPNGPQGSIGFTVSADMTAPLHAVCAAVPEAAWQGVEACAEVAFSPATGGRRPSRSAIRPCASGRRRASSSRPDRTRSTWQS